METAGHVLLWVVRGALLITLWRLGRTRWAFPFFSLYLLAVFVTSWVRPGEWNPIAIAVMDICVLLVGLAATAEACSKLTQFSPHNRSVVHLLLIVMGMCVGITVIGYHGMDTGWNLLESVRLLFATSYATAGAGALLYAMTCSETRGAVRHHALLWTLWMGLHTAVSLLPEPTDIDWYRNQVVYRLVLIGLLVTWTERSSASRLPGYFADAANKRW